jgi:importin subunit alpha-1
VADTSPARTQFVLDCGALPRLSQLLLSTVKKIRREACRVLSNVLAGSEEQFRKVIQNKEIVARIVALLDCPDEQTRQAALYAVSNIISNPNHNDNDIRLLLGNDCIPRLYVFLKEKTVVEALIVLKCLLAFLNVCGGIPDSGQNSVAVEISVTGGLAKIRDLKKSNRPEITEQLERLETHFTSFD